MNRNSLSRFDSNPTNLDMSRSTFNRNSSVKTSFNVGEIVPFYIDEVLPGDTFNVNTSKVVRLQTLLTPLMDNLYLDTYYFYVPNRLLWEHWKHLNGENTANAWTQNVDYEVPQITSPASTGWIEGTIADYFGIPIGIVGLSVNALPFRAYAMIIDQWFRDQNLQQPIYFPLTDATVAGVNTGIFVSDIAKGGLPYIASKYRDYFTSCLPSPQKGEDVAISLSGDLPIYSDGDPIKWASKYNGTTQFHNIQFAGSGSGSTYYSSFKSTNMDPGGTVGLNYYDVSLPTKASGKDSNLIADMSSASSISVNALRTAFAIQKLYEKDARGGSRYIEIIKAHFGVTSPDSRQQRPEYLGGNRVPININQVVQMTETSTPMGDVAGYSLTTDSNSDFTKSFTEHGYIIGVMVARYDHTYQQGIERLWSRKDRFDFYWPVFANIGEQAVLNKEIYAQGNSEDDEIFGYQEAWADYRYKPSRVSGQMRSTATTPLDSWHLGDEYSSKPTLSDAWIREDKTTVDRALAVTSSVSDQLFADIYIMNKTTRPMPMHSIPGLIDHH